MRLALTVAAFVMLAACGCGSDPLQVSPDSNAASEAPLPTTPVPRWKSRLVSPRGSSAVAVYANVGRPAPPTLL